MVNILPLKPILKVLPRNFAMQRRTIPYSPFPRGIGYTPVE